MGDRLVWKRGRENQNDTGPSSSGKFETADKTSGHVSTGSSVDDFSRTITHFFSFREKIPNLHLLFTLTTSDFYRYVLHKVDAKSKD